MTTSKGAGIIAAIFALTVIQLVVGAFGGLDQYEGKGFGYRVILYPIIMLIVPLLWWRDSKSAPLPWNAFVLITSPFLIDVTGNTLDLYDSVEWWDNAVHFFNEMFLLWGCGLLLRLIWTGPTWALVLTITGLGAIFAVGWEIGEWYTFVRRSDEFNGAYEDTLSDELLGILGALAGALIVGRKAPSAQAVAEPVPADRPASRRATGTR